MSTKGINRSKMNTYAKIDKYKSMIIASNCEIDTAGKLLKCWQEQYGDSIADETKETIFLKKVPKNNIVIRGCNGGSYENLGVGKKELEVALGVQNINLTYSS